MQEVFIEGNLLLVDREMIRIKDKLDVVITPKSLIEQYKKEYEEYLKDNLEMSDDGWIRRINDESEI